MKKKNRIITGEKKKGKSSSEILGENPGALHVCYPHQVWPLRSECCGRGAPMKVACTECTKMCYLGGKNSVSKGLSA